MSPSSSAASGGKASVSAAERAVSSGFSGQLRLAQLDQGVHQCVVARGAEMKKPLIDGTPIALGGLEDLPATLQGIAQPFLGEDDPLAVRRPDIIDAQRILAILQDEEPSNALAGDCGPSPTPSEDSGGAVFADAAELDPGISTAGVIAV